MQRGGQDFWPIRLDGRRKTVNNTCGSDNAAPRRAGPGVKTASFPSGEHRDAFGPLVPSFLGPAGVPAPRIELFHPSEGWGDKSALCQRPVPPRLTVLSGCLNRRSAGIELRAAAEGGKILRSGSQDLRFRRTRRPWRAGVRSARPRAGSPRVYPGAGMSESSWRISSTATT